MKIKESGIKTTLKKLMRVIINGKIIILKGLKKMFQNGIKITLTEF
jgi:hypothetical protein